MGSVGWEGHFERLLNQGRAGVASLEGRRYWVAAERARSFASLFPASTFEQNLAEVESGQISRDEALLSLVMGWMSAIGPTTASQLGEALGLAGSDVEKALLRMEACGNGAAGKFYWQRWQPAGRRTVIPVASEQVEARSAGGRMRPPLHNLCPPYTASETEWCERRLLARIHRLTVGMLRKQIEPVTAAEFMRWLLRWQHVAPGSQVAGERGTMEVLQQLQGFEIPGECVGAAGFVAAELRTTIRSGWTSFA